MNITASNIISWIENNNKLAQQELPKIIRRLCYSVSNTKAISFPSGDSTFMPSWDGILDSSKSTPWIPKGKSVWEIGTDKGITTKANSDFQKRNTDTSEDFQSQHTYVFVTPRRWKGKQKWIEASKSKGFWKGVIAYDACDLEEWLETQSAISLEVAELFGLSGYGIQSTQRFLQNWLGQCSPKISTEAFILGREATFEKLDNTISTAHNENSKPIINVYADSIEESVVSAIISLQSITTHISSVVITTNEGWQFVQKNLAINVAICSSSEIAKQAIVRDGLIIIVPQFTGNELKDDSIVIERTIHHQFAEALEKIGVEKSDAKRLAQQTGRSWTVYRRIKAINASIKHPDWLDNKNIGLYLLCLLGSWDSENENDKSLVSQIANIDYEKIESSLLTLKSVNDSPVIKIGNIWKIKSPIETLYLTGQHLTKSLVDRFFIHLQKVFSIPDPALELAVEDRWASAIYDKSFPFSSSLVSGMSNSLVMLAVRGNEITDIDFSSRINNLVRAILSTKETNQWLTLGSYFKSFAEASPEEFLQALEIDIRSDTYCAASLFSESSFDSFTGQNYYTDLLWALEIIAWNPVYLARVCNILLQLMKFQTPSNYSNTPYNTFYSLFRPWYPQTNATVQQRIQLLDKLSKTHEKVIFDVYLSQVNTRQDMTILNAKPKWRDDDAGHVLCESEIDTASMHAFTQCFVLAHQNTSRTLEIIDIYKIQYPNAWINVRKTLDELLTIDISDANCILFQDKLRQIKHYVQVYDWYAPEKKEYFVKKLDDYIQSFKPSSLIQEHLWLFENYHLNYLKTEQSSDYKASEIESTKVRKEVITQIYLQTKIMGLFEFISLVKEKSICIYSIMESKLISLTDCKDFLISHTQFLTTDILHAFVLHHPNIAVTSFNELFSDNKLRNIITDEQYLDVLIRLPFNQKTWNIINLESQEIIDSYWKNTSIGFMSWLDLQDEISIAVEKLLAYKRPVALIDFISLESISLASNTLLDILELLITCPEKQISNQYKIGKIVDFLETQKDFDESRLVNIEYHLFTLFEHREERRLKTLYRALMNEPDFFMQLFISFYGKKNQKLSENERANVRHAYKILNGCQFLPAINKANEVNPQKFENFINVVRTRSNTEGILDACDELLGQILSHSPTKNEDTAILDCVANMLDMPYAEKMRNGFAMGLNNQRGVTSRGIYDGGNQERNLAGKFNKIAEAWTITHPFVANMYRNIAKGYEHQAKRADVDAQLNKENLR